MSTRLLPVWENAGVEVRDPVRTVRLDRDATLRAMVPGEEIPGVFWYLIALTPTGAWDTTLDATHHVMVRKEDGQTICRRIGEPELREAEEVQATVRGLPPESFEARWRAAMALTLAG